MTGRMNNKSLTVVFLLLATLMLIAAAVGDGWLAGLFGILILAGLIIWIDETLERAKEDKS